MEICRFVFVVRSYQTVKLSDTPDLYIPPCIQMCDTWCNIAYVHEKAGHDYEEIKDAYIKALACAEQSGKHQAVVGLRFNNFIILFIDQTQAGMCL